MAECLNGNLSTASRLYTSIFTAVKDLIDSVIAAKSVAPLVISEVVDIQNNLDGIFDVFDQLVSGAGFEVASNLMVLQLLDLNENLVTAVSTFGTGVSIGGDGVATVLTTAIYEVLDLTSHILDAVQGIFVDLENSDQPVSDLVDKSILPLITYLENNLTYIVEMRQNIIGGVPTGPIAPVYGLAAALTTPYQKAALIFASILPSNEADTLSFMIIGAIDAAVGILNRVYE